MSLAVLFFLTILQNAAFTLVSRSRNSGNVARHAIFAVFSNGIWFAVNFFTVMPVMLDALKDDAPTNDKYIIMAIYTAGTVVGSCLMMAISLGKIYIPYLSEKGKDQVGSR